MAFRKKYACLLPFAADIVSIQECEHIDKLADEWLQQYPYHHWVGKNEHKGLALFAKEPFEITYRYDDFSIYFRTLHSDIFGLALWVQDNKVDRQLRYVGGLNYLLEQTQQHIRFDKRCVLFGDLNASVVFDKKSRKLFGNFADFQQRMGVMSLHSVYHKLHQQSYGNETDPTFYLYRHLDKPYHFDYVYASTDIMQAVTACEIGMPEDFLGYSDHMPMMVEFAD